MGGVAGSWPGRVKPGERDRIGVFGHQVVSRQIVGGYFLDREFHARELGLPPRLELGDGLEHEIIEPLGAAPVQR